MRDLSVYRASFEVAEPHPIRREHGHVAIRQEKHVARVVQDGRHIGGDKIFTIAQSDDHRRAIAGGDDFIRVSACQHGQGEDAGQLLDGNSHRVFQVPLEVLLHQVGDDFGVRLRGEHVPLGFELVLERKVIFNDAVVHHHDIALAIAMRVRVLFRGPPVRGPARVPDAVTAVDRVLPDGFFQVAQLSRGAANSQRIVIAINGDARRVIAAVFEAFQALEDNRNSLPLPDITDNSTHFVIMEAGTRVRFGERSFDEEAW